MAEVIVGEGPVRAPKTFVVVQDPEGVVGAFESVARACEVLRPFAGVPFVFHRWPGAGAEAWILPFHEVGVAFASTSRAATARMQQMLLPVGHVPPDDVDHWRAKMNEPVGPARRRLDMLAETLAAAKAGGDEMLGEAKSVEDEVAANFLRNITSGRAEPLDESRINIFEGVVPAALVIDSGDGTADAGEASPEAEAEGGAEGEVSPEVAAEGEAETAAAGTKNNDPSSTGAGGLSER